MKAIHFALCLCMAVMLSTFSSLAIEEDFKILLQKFTSSASFQYSRIRFPLKSPIILLKGDRETEQTFPFIRDKWALLDSETLREGCITEEEGGTYILRLMRDGPAHREPEAGCDESEPSSCIVLDLIGGKWHVTDCYNDWYNSDLSVSGLEETVRTMQEENKAFEELHS